jgi:hypothetical protein
MKDRLPPQFDDEETSRYERQPERPNYVDELMRSEGLKVVVDDKNKTVTVSRKQCLDHKHRLGIFRCIEDIGYYTGWAVLYKEDSE